MGYPRLSDFKPLVTCTRSANPSSSRCHGRSPPRRESNTNCGVSGRGVLMHTVSCLLTWPIHTLIRAVLIYIHVSCLRGLPRPLPLFRHRFRSISRLCGFQTSSSFHERASLDTDFLPESLDLSQRRAPRHNGLSCHSNQSSFWLGSLGPHDQ